VPIGAYNNKVSSLAHRLPHFFPLTDDIAIFTFDLLLGDVPWVDALRQLGKYLNSPYKSNKRVTNFPELPCVVTANLAFPLYIIARRFRLDRLAGLFTETAPFDSILCDYSVAF
jgi:hypothetical protein